MHDFKYCIWMMPEKNHNWNKITNGFTPHMTIKSHLEIDEIFNILFEKFENNKKILILN